MWEVISYGGGEYLVQVFTAMKLFFGGPFQSLAQVAGVIGLMAVLMAYLGPRPNLDFPYIIRFAVFYGALFVPKADVAIIDRIDNPVSQVVTDVPLGLAAFAGITSHIGDRLTILYESYLSMPDDHKYHKNGMVFGATMLKHIPQAQFAEATFAGDMQEFISHCVFSSLASGALMVEDIEKSGDIWTMIRDSAPDNRFVAQSWSVTPVTCRDAATEPGRGLDDRMPDRVEESQNAFARMLWPKKPIAIATAEFNTLLPATASDVVGITRTSSEIMRQAMLINAIGAALDKLPASETSGAMASIQAKTAAERSRFETYMTMGAVAARSVPIMKAVLEALAYALFPVVGLMILLPAGLLALSNYFFVLMWLQMWPVIYAVLNSIVYAYSVHANKADAMMPSGLTDWSMWSTPALVSTNSEIVAMGGYLALLVPMIAYMLVKGGAMIGSQVATNLMQPAQAAAAQAGREAAYGTFSSGVSAVDTHTAHNTTINQSRTGYVNDTSSATVRGHIDRDGPYTTYTSTDGHKTHHAITDDYGIRMVLSKGILGELRKEAQSQEQAAHEYAVSYIGSAVDSTMKAFGVRLGHEIARVTQDGARIEKGTNAEIAGMRVKDTLNRWEKGAQYSEEDKFRMFLAANAEVTSGDLGRVVAYLVPAFRVMKKVGAFGKDTPVTDEDKFKSMLEKDIAEWRKQTGRAGKDDKDGVEQKGAKKSGVIEFLDRFAAVRGGAEGAIYAGLANTLRDMRSYSEGSGLRDQYSRFTRALDELYEDIKQEKLDKSGLQEWRSAHQKMSEDRDQYQAALRKSVAYSDAAAIRESSGASIDSSLMPEFSNWLIRRYGIVDPAKFVHNSLITGDNNAIRLVNEFAREKADREANGLVGNRIGSDVVGLTHEQYVKDVNESSVENRVTIKREGDEIKNNMNNHGVDPRRAAGVRGPGASGSGVRRMARKEAEDANKQIDGARTQATSGSSIRPEVESKTKGETGYRGMYDHAKSAGARFWGNDRGK